MEKFTQFKKTKINEQEISLSKPEETNSGTSSNLENTSKSDPSKFFSKLLESREMAQVYHWTVKGDQGSYSEHVALDIYYKEIIELIDTLIETYSGQYDIVEGYDIIDTKDTKTKDKITYFNEVCQFIKDNRYEFLSKEDTHLQNIIDNVIANIYQLLFKLRFNK